ncbi:hypothetical protein DQ04_00101260 [Trypanosoma grayi]|uniref:hypothetical protein n=1 Tax=Trypanosoma grayi TaxID=71804 RepID=UPI0004F41524|nr:hypothetical protein DQ04_00101260 [Trypanosoma grayi]KEG15359.1 hypothetical protein DQ04_00101260 [Trypanosoma grayi]
MQHGANRCPPVSLLLFLQSAPPQLTFAAFREDCRACGMPWYCTAAQQLCVALLLRNPLVRQYPQRKANVRAFLKHFITQLELPETAALLAESPDEDIIDTQLMEAYVECSTSFEGDAQTCMCYKTFYSPDSPVAFVPVRLAVGQFANVGLALWPAAFALVQLLREAPLAACGPVILPSSGEMRLLELGAGVGLTPLMLHRLPWYEQRVRRCVLTDYQSELIDNIHFNLRSHGIAVEGSTDRSCNGEGEGVVHAAEILDWTEHGDNSMKVQRWGCNVILAADCVYDVSLIDAFVTTVHQALGAVEDAVAIVVQTHRQAETMQRFFNAVRKAELSVQSYRLVPVTAENSLRLSSQEGNVILRSIVCADDSNSGFAVMRDEVGADGNFMGDCATSCGSGWMGAFFVQLEAVVGVHVLRLQKQ